MGGLSLSLMLLVRVHGLLVLQVFATKGLSIKSCELASGQDACKCNEGGAGRVGRNRWEVKDSLMRKLQASPRPLWGCLKTEE